MKWIGITGSWRKTNKQVERDVRNAIKQIIRNGDGIITGGALGVDYFALDEAIKHDAKLKQIKVFLPVKLDLYVAHYLKRAKEGIITNKQAEQLINQLALLKEINSQALIENKENIIVNPQTYYQRNTVIVDNSDKLIAFHVNKSPGTQDTIEKAQQKGLFVKVYSYQI